MAYLGFGGGVVTVGDDATAGALSSRLLDSRLFSLS